MPYLQIRSLELTAERRVAVARRLTDELNDLFYHPRARLTREELRERTTLHFIPYQMDELFIGGRTSAERETIDLTVELADWYMSVRQQRRVAKVLTPVLAELFGVPPEGLDEVNIVFRPYPPTNFAVGGRLLADLIPRIGQFFKRFFN